MYGPSGFLRECTTYPSFRIVLASNVGLEVLRKHGDLVGSGATHLLNLTVQEGMEISLPTLKKVRRVHKFFKKSAQAAEKLREIQAVLRQGKPTLKLLRDVCTRFNSTFIMLERYVELSMCVNAVLAECGRREHILSDNELQAVKELCTILGPFHEATKELSGEAYPTLSIVLPLINGLIFTVRCATVTNPQVLEIQNSLLTT